MKILAVDDNQTDLKRLESVLLGAGCQVIVATNGDQAIESALTHKPNGIFLDVNMPGTDGYAAARKILADAETKHIPIIFVTSKGEKADKAWGQMLGAKGHVTKPYSDDDVLAELKKL